MSTGFYLISNYKDLNLRCYLCGEKESIRYTDSKGNTYCNKCALSILKKEHE